MRCRPGDNNEGCSVTFSSIECTARSYRLCPSIKSRFDCPAPSCCPSCPSPGPPPSPPAPPSASAAALPSPPRSAVTAASTPNPPPPPPPPPPPQPPSPPPTPPPASFCFCTIAPSLSRRRSAASAAAAPPGWPLTCRALPVPRQRRTGQRILPSLPPDALFEPPLEGGGGEGVCVG
ncbi:unnamed protein product [Closterium sp. NIES-53]